jgi:hypothetical protein
MQRICKGARKNNLGNTNHMLKIQDIHMTLHLTPEDIIGARKKYSRPCMNSTP